jgi:uncharacterized membrane protein SpoIIM required for sporulation
MAEALPAFVARRRPDWAQLEGLLSALDARRIAASQLRELDVLYRRAAADLAHAQSFYPSTDAHRFLNQLCGRAYGRIYQQRRSRTAAAAEFFRRGFPRAVREELPFIGASAALLFAGALVGLTTLLVQPDLAPLFVPEPVQRFVGAHRLWTDALQLPPSELATTIISNNLQATVGAFALGIFAGVGTILMLLYNGVTIGALVAHCFNGGVGPGILVFMSSHGYVELSIVSICGGAGLIIGHALVVPGERPRAEVLRERAARAVQLVVGCAPFLAGIGIVEGFISPGQFFPWPVKIALGPALGLAFWTYLLSAKASTPSTKPSSPTDSPGVR